MICDTQRVQPVKELPSPYVFYGLSSRWISAINRIDFGNVLVCVSGQENSLLMKQIIDHLNVLTDPFLRDLFPSVHHFWSHRMLPVLLFDCLMQIYVVIVGLAGIQSDRFVNVSNARPNRWADWEGLILVVKKVCKVTDGK